MTRILLVHWNSLEAREPAAILRQAGHTVTIHSTQGAASLRRVRDRPPDLVIIDLGRLPSHGRAVGTWLRQSRATRQVPLVFLGGAPAATEKVRAVLPDAVFTDARSLRSAVRRALSLRVTTPVVPGTMDDYAGTPLLKKLGITDQSTLALLGAPDGLRELLGPLPEGTRVMEGGRAPAAIVVLFARSARDLSRRFPQADRAVLAGGRLWIAWPKKTSRFAADLGQREVRAFGLERGWVDYKICAVDADWSALCFSRRGAPRRGTSRASAIRRAGPGRR